MFLTSNSMDDDDSSTWSLQYGNNMQKKHYVNRNNWKNIYAFQLKWLFAFVLWFP